MTSTTIPRLTDLERRDVGIRPEPYSGKPGRTVKTEWLVAKDVPDTVRGKNVDVFVQLTTSHHGTSSLYGVPEKIYISRFSWVTRGDVFETWTSSNRTVKVHEEPTPRYSAKGLLAAHAKAVETVLGIHDESNLALVTEQAAEYDGGR